jgi:PAS domain S-box-containing protein
MAISMFSKLVSILFLGSRRAVAAKACAFTAVVAFIDWRVIAQIPLGFLYLIPMAMIGSSMGLFPIFGMASVCTFLAEAFSDLAWNLRTGASRDLLYFAAFVGVGLFTREVARSREATERNVRAIERERDARREAEAQLQILIESSPVSIVVAEASGKVLMANEAAHRLLGVAAGELEGKTISRYLPALTNVCTEEPGQRLIRAVMQARGQREDGEAFLADICFSTYSTNAGERLAAMVLDSSEDLREHEVAGMHQLLEGSRIAVGALSHEIRNVCGAIALVHRNLKSAKVLENNKDFEALGSLVAALEQIASVNLRQTGSHASEVDLNLLLDELKIIVAPQMEEEEIAVEWDLEANLPLIWADRSSLMQAFLNLTMNSTRALAKKETRRLAVSAHREGDRVLVKVTDNGGGVGDPERLFRPFQAGSEASGLGLFLSRAFVRSFRGELRYVPVEGGACFIVELIQAAAPHQDLECQTSAS